MQFTYKLERAKKELVESAKKHFAGATPVSLTAELPDVAESEQDTIARLIESAGSVANLRNTYVAQARLARQKAVKDAANELGPKVEAGEMTLDAAVQQLTDILNSPVQVTIRGEGTTTRKPSGKTKEKAKAEVKQEMATTAASTLEGLSGKELKGAIETLRRLGIPVPEQYNV